MSAFDDGIRVRAARRPVTVMLSCVGRQVSLVRAFQTAENGSVRVLTADSDPMAAGAAVATKSFLAPPVHSGDYPQWMRDVCIREEVTLLITLLPEDLLVLERHRDAFESHGIKLVGMPIRHLERCIDKLELPDLCRDIGVLTLPTWSLERLESVPESAMPVMIKQRWGKGSRGMQRADTWDEAHAIRYRLSACGNASEYIVQSFVSGTEFGIDVVNDLEGNFVSVLGRRKFRMRDGETEVAETVDDRALQCIGNRLGSYLGHSGVIDCDIMRCQGRDYVLDINPRFGGGYIFNHAAGANVPGAIIAWLVGRQVPPAWVSSQPNRRAARTGVLLEIGAQPKHLVILTMGNHRIGMGHVVRQLAIARAAIRKGNRVTVISCDSEVISYAQRHSVDAIIVSFEDQDVLRAQMRSICPTHLIIDVPQNDFTQFSWMEREWQTTLMLSPVGFDFPLFGANVVLMGEELASWRCERFADAQESRRIFSGRAFICFRESFKHARAEKAEEREAFILIAHGGSDPHGLTLRSLEALEYSERLYTLKVLLGCAFSDSEKIRQAASQSKHSVHLIEDQEEIVALMDEAAVAIINGGNIRYELCLTGTPWIALGFQPSQVRCTEQLTTMGVGVNLGLAAELSDRQIAAAADSLFSNMELRERMRETMVSLFDTDGVDRLVTIALETPAPCFRKLPPPDLPPSIEDSANGTVDDAIPAGAQ